MLLINLLPEQLQDLYSLINMGMNEGVVCIDDPFFTFLQENFQKSIDREDTVSIVMHWDRS